LIAGKLDVMRGEMFRSGKLRIGYFSQHQTEELDVNSTPYLEMLKLMSDRDPNVKESYVRAKLGAFGFSHDLANNSISSLSGGEKARLLFAFMSFDAPHLLLLDEPTNHLDIEAREALVQALNAYEGAIVIVSHDPHMVERVADRLWLIKDGKCQDFDGDLEDYRKFTIQQRREERAADRKARDKQDVQEVSPIIAETAKPEKKLNNADKRKAADAEKKISQLTKKKTELEALMADPTFYSSGRDVTGTQNQYQQITAELEEQEVLWLELMAG
jgi:ATP-binding cassette subfamily F protein 3